jgi:hemoglobin-like flavoprotein
MNFDSVELVRKSYGRCLKDGNFFDKFYDRFLASSPEVKQKFANTDFAKQKMLINKGVNMMIMYATGDNVIANNVIMRLRETHNVDNLDIAPRLYQLWKKALMETISECDSEQTDDILSAWDEVLSLGIDHISAGYNDVSKRTA